jgi:hypothetical protein
MDNFDAPADLDERGLIEGWIRLQYARKNREPADRLIWAHEVLDEICSRRPLDCLHIVVQIAEHDRSDFIAANLAAGPVEDLLSRHGPDVIEAVERQARGDENFRTLLSGVWRSTIEEAVWERVQALVRGSAFGKSS